MSCLGCTIRTLGCHSSCEKYSEYRKVIDKKRSYLQKDVEVEGYSIGRDTLYKTKVFKKKKSFGKY